MGIIGGERPRHAVEEWLVVIGRAVKVLQRRMRHGDMVAFIVDVAHRLPVDRCRLCPDAPGRHHVGSAIVGELRLDRDEQFRDGRLRAALAETEEDEAHPDLEVERHQPELVLVEVWEGARARGPAQRAVEIVDPAVERTDQRVLAGALLVGHDARAAMPAHIVEGAHHAVLAAHDQRPLADHVHGQIIAGARHVADMPDDLPVIAEDALLLQLQQRVGMIAPARQAPAVPLVGNCDVTEMRVHG